jgi:hypothetical protein
VSLKDGRYTIETVSLNGVPPFSKKEMVGTTLRDAVSLEEVQLESDLTYDKKPIKILEIAERVARTKTIRFCKVQWSHHTEEEATWE